MKIIRQFKQGRSQKSIFKSIKPGDVFTLRHSCFKYILCQDWFEAVVVSEVGTVPIDINGLIEYYGGIEAIYHNNLRGENLEHLLIQAEKDLQNRYGKD